MARRLFFVEEVRNGQATVRGEPAAHLTRVLRVEPGQRFEVSDHQRRFLAEVASARRSEVVFRILEPLPELPQPVRLFLFASLVKFDHLEWMVEKATEAGVESIRLVQAERSDKGLLEASRKRMERWRRIVLEASQQARRVRTPDLMDAVPLGAVLPVEAACRLALDEASGAAPLLAALPAARQATDRVAVLVGPEGGWTDREREAIRSAGWRAVTLGPNILRAETASVAALAIVSAAWQVAGAARHAP